MDDDVDSFLYGSEDAASISSGKPIMVQQQTLVNSSVPDQQQDTFEEYDDEDVVEIVLEEKDSGQFLSADASSVSFLKMSAKSAESSVSTMESATGSLAQGNLLDINAIPILDNQTLFDVDIDGFEEKPWRKPGADITDYFNFGFNENSWKQYCYKQKMLRDEFSAASTVKPSQLESNQRNPMLLEQKPAIFHNEEFKREPKPVPDPINRSDQREHFHGDSERRVDYKSSSHFSRGQYDRDRERNMYRHRSRSPSRSRGELREERKRPRDDSRDKDSQRKRRD